MFISLKRREREKQEMIDAGSLLTDAILKNTDQGLFLLDSRGKIMAPVSRALSTLFRHANVANLGIERLLAPLVSAKTMAVLRTQISGLLGDMRNADEPVNRLKNIEVRLTNGQGSAHTAHYCFEFDSVDLPNAPKAWLVRVTDITVQVQTLREVEELRSQVEAQREVLRGVLQAGRARFGTFIKKTDASMKTIAIVLKKSARDEGAFRSKLEEILAEVDRIRREAAAFKLAALEHAARAFEDALHELRGRASLSGGDILPLAVKLDELHVRFALVKSLTLSAAGAPAPVAKERPEAEVASAPLAGSLDSTLQLLTTHIAELEAKVVLLESIGLQLVPQRYQSVVKNVAIQLIRNAIMHGIETPEARRAGGKAPHGTLRLECRLRGGCFELLFKDDGCGLDPDRVRAIAVRRGVITDAVAARMQDRETIKLIFKSRFTTLEDTDAENQHGAGMSLVRRHIHEFGGKIALASLPGHETRFKITLPAAFVVSEVPAPA